MKAANRIHDYLRILRAGEDTEAVNYRRGALAQDLEKVLDALSESRSAEKQWRQAHAAEARLHTDNLRTYAQALNLPATATAQDILVGIRRERTVDASGSEEQDAVLVLQTALNQSRSIDQRITISRAQAWQLLRRSTRKLEHPSQGVQKISDARSYQSARYSQQHDQQPGHKRQLLAAALALTSGVSAIYPFGEDSWEGIRRNGGRTAQLAHAGACIAALIDAHPRAERVDATDGDAPDYRERRARDIAAYPGEAGDLL